MIIDVHAHYYPQRYLELIGRPDLPPVAAAALARQSIGERLAVRGASGPVPGFRRVAHIRGATAAALLGVGVAGR
jgi:hypothetical protein